MKHVQSYPAVKMMELAGKVVMSVLSFKSELDRKRFLIDHPEFQRVDNMLMIQK
jgi:hypothetical protein